MIEQTPAFTLNSDFDFFFSLEFSLVHFNVDIFSQFTWIQIFDYVMFTSTTSHRSNNSIKKKRHLENCLLLSDCSRGNQSRGRNFLVTDLTIILVWPLDLNMLKPPNLLQYLRISINDKQKYAAVIQPTVFHCFRLHQAAMLLHFQSVTFSFSLL